MIHFWCNFSFFACSPRGTRKAARSRKLTTVLRQKGMLTKFGVELNRQIQLQARPACWCACADIAVTAPRMLNVRGNTMHRQSCRDTDFLSWLWQQTVTMQWCAADARAVSAKDSMMTPNGIDFYVFLSYDFEFLMCRICCCSAKNQCSCKLYA